MVNMDFKRGSNRCKMALIINISKFLYQKDFTNIIHNHNGLEKKHISSRSQHDLLKPCSSLYSGVIPLKSMRIGLSKE